MPLHLSPISFSSLLFPDIEESVGYVLDGRQPAVCEHHRRRAYQRHPAVICLSYTLSDTPALSLSLSHTHTNTHSSHCPVYLSHTLFPLSRCSLTLSSSCCSLPCCSLPCCSLPCCSDPQNNAESGTHQNSFNSSSISLLLFSCLSSLVFTIGSQEHLFLLSPSFSLLTRSLFQTIPLSLSLPVFSLSRMMTPCWMTWRRRYSVS